MAEEVTRAGPISKPVELTQKQKIRYSKRADQIGDGDRYDPEYVATLQENGDLKN